jgi:hypothetical protein
MGTGRCAASISTASDRRPDFEDPRKSPLYRPFKEFPKDISRAEHAQLAEAVIPALRGFLAFV